MEGNLMFEILSYTLLQTLAKCRLLDKQCNLLTYESSFLNLHARRTNTTSGYFVQTMRKNKFYSTFVLVDNSKKLDIDFLPRWVKIEACSKLGIMLCVDDHPLHNKTPDYYICKPATKQSRVIPNPNLRYFAIKLALIVTQTNPLRFKIVRLSKQDSYEFVTPEFYNVHCEVFDSVAWVWKRLSDVLLGIDEYFKRNPVVTVCGRAHWLTSRSYVFAFDYKTESSVFFSLPSEIGVSDYFNQIQLVEYEGKLGLIGMDDEDSGVKLWIMEDYANRVWKERLIIETNDRLSSPHCFHGFDIIVMRGFNKLLFFDLKNGRKINEVSIGDHVSADNIFPVQSDFESIGLRDQ